ncbi:MAG: Na+/H+ antiporter NhaA [Nitrospiraceae bacterium]
MNESGRPSGHRPLIAPVVEPFQAFLHTESAGGILLLTAAVVAMLWANSPWVDTYEALRRVPITLGVGSLSLTEPLVLWVNDGLMAMFFFVIGLEIKREMLVGELSSLRRAALPLIAALGGSLVPALIYAWFNAGTEGARGWGIPMATDIAFSLGVLSLLGTRAPLSLKVFLAALAIADDLGAVLVIALFYTSSISVGNLAIGAAFLLVLVAANYAGVRHPLVYAVVGIGGVWLAFLMSGVHATIAGVLAAMTIPARTRLSSEEFVARGKVLLEEFESAIAPNVPVLASEARHGAIHRLAAAAKHADTPLRQLEEGLHPWMTAVVLPLFALVNAGVTLSGGEASFGHPITLGVALGLLFGKPIGVAGAAWVSARFGIVDLPRDITLQQLLGTGFLAGIGFTMSLFIEGLAFGATPLDTPAKIGILAGSTVAGLLGACWLWVVGSNASSVSGSEEGRRADRM